MALNDKYKPLDSWPGLNQRIQQLESQLATARKLIGDAVAVSTNKEWLRQVGTWQEADQFLKETETVNQKETKWIPVQWMRVPR